VALAGDGGDELFGGYPHYRWLLWQDRMRRAIPGSLRRLGRATARRLAPGLPGRNHVIALGGEAEDGVAHINLYFDADFRKRLLVPRPPEGAPRPEERRRPVHQPGVSLLQQATRVDFATTLPDGYLVKVDRASMLSSLEVRTPFLDHRLVEMAFSRLPDRLRSTSREGKILTRRLARKLLPQGADALPKRGFGPPLAAWFKGPWGERVRQVLAEADPALFSRSAIERLWVGQRRGLPNANRLLALAIFELWRREYRVGL
jgi:asparagine synthase (glutamine-hydrolysing)